MPPRGSGVQDFFLNTSERARIKRYKIAQRRFMKVLSLSWNIITAALKILCKKSFILQLSYANAVWASSGVHSNTTYEPKLEWTSFSSVAYASTTIEFSLFQEHLKDGFLLNVLKKLLLQSQETVRNLDRGLLVIWSAFKELCTLIFGYFFLK